MEIFENPFEAPKTESGTQDTSPSEIRRPPFGTFLILLWLLEGSFKVFVVGKGLASGFNPLPDIALGYQQTSWWLFLFVSAYFAIETIGPWVGIYYLTGKRARSLPLKTAVYRTLQVAGITSIVTSLLLMLYCEIAAT